MLSEEIKSKIADKCDEILSKKWYVIRLEDNPDVYWGKENRFIVDGIRAAHKMTRQEAEDTLESLKNQYGRFSKQLYIDECYLNVF